MKSLIALDRIENRIYFIRGQKVMLDAELAKLYGVTTFNFNKAVKRKADHFPEDFMFRLNPKEKEFLRFQFGISKAVGRGGRRYLPYVFTEQGVAMLSGVLKSKQATLANIAIMRAFVKQRQIIAGNQALARQLETLEKKYDFRFKVVFQAIRKLMEPPEKPRKPIGFNT